MSGFHEKSSPKKIAAHLRFILCLTKVNKNHSGLMRTFIMPGCCADLIAAGALVCGNVRVMSERRSTFPERNSAMAFAKGPQGDPTSVISLTTKGQVSTGAAP